MATQTLIFVLLPNGLTAQKRLRASVYLTPRLDNGGTLADFPDVLKWPALIKAHGLQFQVTCGAQSVTVPVDTSVLRPEAWAEIFTPQTFVEAYQIPPLDQRLVVSYPVRDALSYAKYAYQVVGSGNVGGGDIPPERALRNLVDPLVFRDGKQSTLDDAVNSTRLALWNAQRPTVVGAPRPRAAAPRAVPSATPLPPDGAPTSTSTPANAQTAATQFAAFHRMPPAPGRPPLPSKPADFEKTLDFHRALTALNSYPSLLRAMGLVFDIELPATLCPASPNATGYGSFAVSQVTPGFGWSSVPVFSFPQTAYFLDSSSFTAAPKTDPASLATGNYLAGDVIDGMLALAQDSFSLLQMDLDGALLNALSYADNVANVLENFNADPAAQSRIEAILPAMRSGGISLIAAERGQQLVDSILNNQSFNQALTSNQGYPRAFNATDLVRGYRIDIWESRTGEWHSLHRRDATYRFGPGGGLIIGPLEEEGFWQTTATQPADDPTRPPDQFSLQNGLPQPSTDLYVHERVARWDGWSLSVKRPGLALNRDPDPAKVLDDDPSVNQPITPFKMVSTFTVAPGSLPELRFGREYQCGRAPSTWPATASP
jgi:hypothetical protein